MLWESVGSETDLLEHRLANCYHNIVHSTHAEWIRANDNCIRVVWHNCHWNFSFSHFSCTENLLWSIAPALRPLQSNIIQKSISQRNMKSNKDLPYPILIACCDFINGPNSKMRHKQQLSEGKKKQFNIFNSKIYVLDLQRIWYLHGFFWGWCISLKSRYSTWVSESKCIRNWIWLLPQRAINVCDSVALPASSIKIWEKCCALILPCDKRPAVVRVHTITLYVHKISKDGK